MNILKSNNLIQIVTFFVPILLTYNYCNDMLFMKKYANKRGEKMNNDRKKINKVFNRIISIIIVAIMLTMYLLIAPINKSNAATYNQTIINANSNNNNGIDAFPESYKVLLNKLVQETGHSNWKFKAFYTDIDWKELTNGQNENKCLRNTVYKNNPSNWFCSANAKHLANGKCGDGYYCASPKAVSYFLDPRNFLTEITIFQFLNLGYDNSESIEVIQEALNGSFMEGTAANGERYANIIYDASQASGESALSIVTRIYQEIGKRSPGDVPNMVSGKDSTYPNTYNFFNYGATDGTGAQKRGLAYADSAGWHDPRTALVEGAKLIANGYTKAGQNTKYTFKFDVVGSEYKELYSHQYMTNLRDPTNQSKLLYDEYVEDGLLNNSLTFIIPIYKNMPTYNKLPSNLSGSELYYVSPTYKAPSLRTGIGTGNSEICTVSKDTLVTMVQYNAGTDNYGTQWHKIRLEDGTEGYMTSEYITKVNNIVDYYNVPSQPADENGGGDNKPIENGDFKFDGDKCIVTPSTTIATIKQKCTINSATKNGNNIGDNDLLPTGTVIETNNGKYTIAKLGDVSGDGIIDARDASRILKYSINEYTLDNEYNIAGDVSRDGMIDARDASRILKYSINEYNISL